MLRYALILYVRTCLSFSTSVYYMHGILSYLTVYFFNSKPSTKRLLQFHQEVHWQRFCVHVCVCVCVCVCMCVCVCVYVCVYMCLASIIRNIRLRNSSQFVSFYIDYLHAAAIITFIAAAYLTITSLLSNYVVSLLLFLLCLVTLIA